MNHPSLFRSIVLAGVCGASAAVAAADVATSENAMSYEDKLASCAACHGENGAKPIVPEYPVLAGQYADYLAAALAAYRSGRRQNPIMNMQVEVLELSDAEIAKMAAHFAAQKGVTTLPD